MVQLKAKRTALVLYGLLLVLPTAVLGGLLWEQLVQDHTERLLGVPREVDDASDRLFKSIERRCRALIYSQDHESYYAYRDPHLDRSAGRGTTPLLRSNIVTDPRPEIPLWFYYDARAGAESEPTCFEGTSTGPELRAELEASLRDMIRADFEAREHLGDSRKTNVAPFMHPLLCTATFAAGPEHLQNSLDYFERNPELYDATSVVLIYAFQLRFFRTNDTGDSRLLVTRTVELAPSEDLRDCAECPEYFDRIREGYEEIQGFFIDPEWFFETVPREEASAVLGHDLQIESVQEGSMDPRIARADFFYSDIALAEVAGMELYRGASPAPGKFRISASTSTLQDRFQRQSLRFLGVVLMVTISLILGMVLLLRMVHRDLKQAERTENFVAAVTHELRTPLTAIRLYGEMLNDGWVPEEEKRAEYYRRILRETGRLETLVERVLTKARLSSSEMKVEPGDLNHAVESSVVSFSGHVDGDRDDYEMELAAALPVVDLNPDAVNSIVTNLVENARKYAPPEPGEPIRIETRLHADRVVLEVSDRGPGIPESELPHIFEAFFRIGTEATRTTKGTGLGLHLVAIQSSSMGGEVEALPRPGGGSVFRVTFRNSALGSNGAAN